MYEYRCDERLKTKTEESTRLGNTRTVGCLLLINKAIAKERLVYDKFDLLYQLKRDLKRIHTNGCRCNERLITKTEGSKRLAYTGLRG